MQRRDLLCSLGRAGLGLLAAAPAARAAAQQVRIDVSGVGASLYPIAIAGFAAEAQAPLAVSEVVRANLVNSGAFRAIDAPATATDSGPIPWGELRGRGADALVVGSVQRLADGRLDVRFRLYDAVRQTQTAGESFALQAADLRFAAHRISDMIYEKLLGVRSIFATRIAFVSRQGTRYRLNVADWDGENIQSPLSSPEPIISPAWSPDGTRLAYVSFEAKKPVVYVHTLATGQRQAVANFKGSNSAPAWSPDGRTLAVALTRDGLSQLYLIASNGSGEPRRLTSSAGIDTEPAFTPDGRQIFFTSDRGGSPQIYRVALAGGDPSRVTFEAPYNVSPRVSPDGQRLAYITRRGGRFLVALRDIGGGPEQILSDGGREESPSFAPNGRWILYATSANGRDLLVAVTTDGRVRQRLTSSALDIREPVWGPFAS